jgi:hypothetical protein
MNLPLPRSVFALAAVSAAVLAPTAVDGAPAPEHAVGGPGTSATLAHGVLTVHRNGATAQLPVPAGYHLPFVTVRGERGGISFDGSTVVLAAGGTSADGRSRFLVAEGGRLTPLTFRGRVAFDAVAPSGSAIYLTRRTSPSDATRYVVLQYTRSAKTLSQIGVKSVFSADGAEQADWKMRGLPVARTAAADGSWAYTLYTAREYPFIHALPLGQGPWAVCIELPASWHARVATMRLRARPGNIIEVLNAAGAVVATADVLHAKLKLAAQT